MSSIQEHIDELNSIVRRHSPGDALNIGATVKMTRHIGALFLYTIINRIGDDCDIKDARGRIIPNVPVDFLERVGDEPKSVEAT